MNNRNNGVISISRDLSYLTLDLQVCRHKMVPFPFAVSLLPTIPFLAFASPLLIFSVPVAWDLVLRLRHDRGKKFRNEPETFLVND